MRSVRRPTAARFSVASGSRSRWIRIGIVGVGADRRERLVDLVRHAGGELAERGEAPRMGELASEALALGFGALPLGDLGLELPVGLGEGLRAHPHPLLELGAPGRRLGEARPHAPAPPDDLGEAEAGEPDREAGDDLAWIRSRATATPIRVRVWSRQVVPGIAASSGMASRAGSAPWPTRTRVPSAAG